MIYACGPTPMLKAIKEYALEKGIECQLSLEERMACGIGACLACVCQSKEKDHHSNVNNKRICKDGPVFLAEEVLLDIVALTGGSGLGFIIPLYHFFPVDSYYINLNPLPSESSFPSRASHPNPR